MTTLSSSRRKRPAITGLYCSSLGHACSNAEMLAINRERIIATGDKATAKLYEKLLRKEPERQRKFTVAPYETLFELDIHKKHEIFQRASRALLDDVGHGVLESAGIKAEDVDFLILCYMAGKSLPSLNAVTAHLLGLRPEVVSYTLGDMGCSAAVAALDLAGRLLRAERQPKRALVIALEPVSSLFQQDGHEGAVVGNTLFGEGCAGVIVSSYREPALYVLGPSQRILSTDEQALNAITLKPRASGPMIDLSREIPEVAARAVTMNLQRLVPRVIGLGDKLRYLMTKRIPRWQKRIARWAIHPGGSAVLRGMQNTLQLSRADVGPSYRVFHERSNMSSPSVFYALDNIERAGPRRGEKVLMMSFGSGFKVNSIVLKRGKRAPSAPVERNAVIIGGTSGIGLEVVRLMRDRGYRIFVGSRRVAGDGFYPRIDGVTYLPVDVTDPASVASFAERVWQETFGIDVLVLSSGVAPKPAAIGKQTEDAIHDTVATNLTGAILATNALLPHMRARSHMIFLNSILGRIPLMGNATYCATKAGLQHFCEALRIELKRAGRAVQIHSLFPAYVTTPMYEKVTQSSRALLRPIAPEQVADEIGRLVAGKRRRRGGFLLVRDRLIATFYGLLPWVFRRIVAAF